MHSQFCIVGTVAASGGSGAGAVLELCGGCWDASSLSQQQTISHLRDEIAACIFETSWSAMHSPAGDWQSEASQDGSESLALEASADDEPVAIDSPADQVSGLKQ